MRDLKSFEEFVRTGVVKRVSIDKERAKSLIKESERKMRSLKVQLEKIGVNDDNANDYVEHCFDSMMNLVRAKLYSIGYSAGGHNAHEAEVSYLKELGFTEKEVRFADQLRFFRNRILYYGMILDKEYAEKVIIFAKQSCSKLKEIVKVK